ncbi:MAG: hypothetical protein ABR543_08605 [Gemmatimonadaceae bacterium]
MRLLQRLPMAMAIAWLALPALAVVHAQEAAPGGERRAQLEQRFRTQVGRVVQKQLGLSDEEARKLGAVNQRYEEQRRTLVQQERDIRLALRQEMRPGEAANQQRVAELIDRMLRVQRQRLDIVEREQKDLSEFLTPVQRARYLGVQEQVRKLMEDLRRRRTGDGPGPGNRRDSGAKGRPRP